MGGVRLHQARPTSPGCAALRADVRLGARAALRLVQPHENNVYEDLLAPDAFGAQLLGQGYAGRIPSDPDWEQVDLENGATLVVHRDPEAWFGRPLPPVTSQDFIALDPAYPTPEVLVQARETFSAILQTFDRISKGDVDPLG